MIKEHLIEFNQQAMTYGEGSEVMLNRVMTKDNIALAVFLETLVRFRTIQRWRRMYLI